MSWRTTGILFVVLLVVGAAAYLTSRQEPAAATATPGAMAPTAQTAALGPELELAQVTRLEIQRTDDGTLASFARDETGAWSQTAPTQTQVISATMDSHATGLLNLTSRRTLAADENPLSAYGLDSPAYEIVIAGQSGERALRVTLLVGDTTAADDGYYVQKRGDPRVHIVSKFSLDGIINLLESPPVPLPTPTPFMSVITDTLTITATATLTATITPTGTVGPPETPGP